MGVINHFKILMDKLFALYSTSSKNRMELKESANSLEIKALWVLMCSVTFSVPLTCQNSTFSVLGPPDLQIKHWAHWLLLKDCEASETRHIDLH